MGFVAGNNGKKELSVELNLMPVFDILAVCICFLLMTVVWVQVGMIKTSQGLGGQSQSETKTLPTVWITINEKSDVTFSFKNTKSKMSDRTLAGKKREINLSAVKNFVKSLNEKGFEIALLMPASNTSYNDIIQIVDGLKEVGIKDVGISPL